MQVVAGRVFTYEITDDVFRVVKEDSFTLVSVICNTTTQGSVLGNWQNAAGIQSTALSTYQGIPINCYATSGLPLELTITAPSGCTIQIMAS